MKEITGFGQEDGKALARQLMLKKACAWDVIQDKEAVMTFSQSYKAYLDQGKTERECCQNSVAILEANGFKPLADCETLVPGQKVYQTVKGKGLVAAVLGKESIAQGMNILGAHIDAPRLDLKPVPLYEDGNLVLCKTQYYGGVKKYQWSTIQLALHGVIYTQDGTKLQVNIGEDPEDPVFTVSELLIHLSQEQFARKGNEIVKAEELNLLVGGIPYEDEEIVKRFKLGLLRLLNEKYNLIEEDFISGELELVPADHARDIGFDRGFVGSYGQDDRVCAYTALRALLDMEAPERTSVCVFTDKEEIGSCGNSGARSRLYENVFMALLEKATGGYSQLTYNRMLENSWMLSADVTAGYDPTYSSAHDKQNNAYISNGVALTKYTGARGKSGASDCGSEFYHQVTAAFNAANVPWQSGIMGKVDLGGGGTVAMFMADMGMNVLDCGVPLLSMHAPLEVASKADIYSAYLGFKCFLDMGQDSVSR